MSLFSLITAENGISVPLPVELFLVCMDILQTLCLAVLDGCPHELTNHLHVVVANLIPIARLVHTAQGKQVGYSSHVNFWKV